METGSARSVAGDIEHHAGKLRKSAIFRYGQRLNIGRSLALLYFALVIAVLSLNAQAAHLKIPSLDIEIQISTKATQKLNQQNSHLIVYASYYSLPNDSARPARSPEFRTVLGHAIVELSAHGGHARIEEGQLSALRTSKQIGVYVSAYGWSAKHELLPDAVTCDAIYLVMPRVKHQSVTLNCNSTSGFWRTATRSGKFR